jgi:hypothetical protein
LGAGAACPETAEESAMRLVRILVLGAAAFSTGLLGSWGCDSVDAAFDCQRVCQRYHDCYDTNYDVDHCRSQCRTRSANDPTVRNKADACEACIGDMSCLSATFNCGTTCGVIVP